MNAISLAGSTVDAIFPETVFLERVTYEVALFDRAAGFYRRLPAELTAWGRGRLSAREIRHAARSRRLFLMNRLTEVLDEVEREFPVFP